MDTQIPVSERDDIHTFHVRTSRNGVIDAFPDLVEVAAGDTIQVSYHTGQTTPQGQPIYDPPARYPVRWEERPNGQVFGYVSMLSFDLDADRVADRGPVQATDIQHTATLRTLTDDPRTMVLETSPYALGPAALGPDTRANLDYALPILAQAFDTDLSVDEAMTQVVTYDGALPRFDTDVLTYVVPLDAQTRLGIYYTRGITHRLAMKYGDEQIHTRGHWRVGLFHTVPAAK